MMIGNHDYTFAEVNYGGLNRGVLIIINRIGANNNTERYRLGHEYNPHKLDSNWYLNRGNYRVFFRELGTAVARRLESGQQNWNNQINWPHAIHARINGNGYHAIRQDLY
ncbi:MAG: hypothetical protein K2K54_12835 [Lachnospiraceae bacterium]|nr:hypothetical protein [Lachnospiraceae bacterium]